MPKAVDPQPHNSDTLYASCGDTQGEPTDEGARSSIVHQRARVVRIWRGVAVESYRTRTVTNKRPEVELKRHTGPGGNAKAQPRQVGKNVTVHWRAQLLSLFTYIVMAPKCD